MSKHEIRLRKQRIAATGADRFRNFDVVMKRHEREMRFKKIIRIVSLFAVLLTLLLLILMFVVLRISKTQDAKVKNSSTAALVIKS